MANTLKLHRNGAVGFIDLLDVVGKMACTALPKESKFVTCPVRIDASQKLAPIQPRRLASTFHDYVIDRERATHLCVNQRTGVPSLTAVAGISRPTCRRCGQVPRERSGPERGSSVETTTVLLGWARVALPVLE